MPVTLNVYVTDESGVGIGGARVVALTKNQIIDPPTRLTSGDGGCNLYFNGPAFNPPIAVSLAIDADGYQPWCIQDAPIQFGAVSVDYRITLKRSFKPPFKAAPRFWKANMCGVRVPGLPAVAGGAADPILVLSWFYDRYTEEERKLIRSAWKARGYTHTLLSWPDSRAAGRSPQQFRDTCIELVREGFYPAVMWCSKDHDPADTQQILTNIMPALKLVRGIIPIACVGWELSLWLNPTQVQILIDNLAELLVPTGCKLYVHFQQGYGSFQQDGGVFADFWNPNVGKLTGLLHQKILTQTPAEYRGESGGLVDILDRFAGGFGVSGDSGFGHPFDLVALEISAAYQFEGLSEADGDKLGQWAIDTPAVNGVGVMGSGNGLIS